MLGTQNPVKKSTQQVKKGTEQNICSYVYPETGKRCTTVLSSYNTDTRCFLHQKGYCIGSNIGISGTHAPSGKRGGCE